MSSLAGFAYTPENVRELDRIAIQKAGISGYKLMTRAGRTAFNSAVDRFPDAHRWLIICGSGNNAGDGYIVARLARQSGHEVTVVALGETYRLDGDAGRAWVDYHEAGGTAVDFDPQLLASTDLVFDAMLGTGMERPLEGVYLDIVDAVTKSNVPVVAIDIPTGLNGSTGDIMGGALRAQLTVSFVGLKQGFYLGQGPEYVGEVVFDDLEVPYDVVSDVPAAMRVYRETDLERILPARSRAAHKGHFGHVLIVGGNTGMAGAARLAGEAALRTGAGLVTVATLEENLAAITGTRPELMCRGVEKPRDIDDLVQRASVIALGPGLGQDYWAAGLLRRLIRTKLPKVLDADALNLLSGKRKRRDDWILTPHPGEAARMLRTDTATIQSDRLAALKELNEVYGGVAVLKGPGTLIASRGALPVVIERGNPGMATAGMGDVLTGVIAAVVAQAADRSLLESAATGAFVHAIAGDAAAADGQRGLIASDLLAQLKSCLNHDG